MKRGIEKSIQMHARLLVNFSFLDYDEFRGILIYYYCVICNVHIDKMCTYICEILYFKR